MRRRLLAISWSLLAAGAIGAGLSALLWNGDEELALQTPLPTRTQTTSGPSPSPSPFPASTVFPTASPSSTRAPATSAPRAPATRPARTVNCDETPTFCSDTTGTMDVRGGKLEARGTMRHQISYANVPKTTMTWKILRPGGEEAQKGDRVAKLIVEADISNETPDRTFVFPRREVALVVFRNGQKFHEVVTDGDRFEMPPGGRLKARYEVPIAYDGEYAWRAKTWFYEKR